MRKIHFIFILIIHILAFNQPITSQEKAHERPKVGVVLSGGGAKGMAHISALKVIEEAGVPIDYIVGTSMGSIIGGLYSIGYTPAQMDSMVHKQDWTFLLTDKIVSTEQNITQKENKETYLLSVPIHKDMKKEILSGLIRGENLANLFSELTIGYHDSIDFNTLKTPFACVSEDIVSGKPYVFHNGILTEAMRSSMAIPAVFTPVRKDSMVLVDGGAVNNYPVDVAKAMGADYIIGIDVQSDKRNANELTSAKDIIFQLVNMMGSDLYKENLKNTDVYIKVNVEGYSSASFTPDAIDSLIRRGEEAATAQLPALRSLKKMLGLPNYYKPDRGNPYPCMQNKIVKVNNITINGMDQNDEKWIEKHFNLQENSEISIDKIKEIANDIRANLNYKSAIYHLTRSETNKGYDLSFDLTKQTDDKINVGFRFDSEENASLLINMTGHLKRKSKPNIFSATIRLGKRMGADISYAWAPSPMRKIGLQYSFRYNDINFYYNNRKVFNTNFRYHKAEIAYSDVWHTNLGFSLGVRYELYDYSKFLYEPDFYMSSSINLDTEHFFTYFAKIKYDSTDKPYFPSKGMIATASYEYITDNFAKYYDIVGPSAVQGSIESVIRMSHRFATIPFIYGRFLFGKTIPYSKMNVMGGDVPGYMMEKELPFVGVNTAQLMNHSLVVGGIKLRQRIGKAHYITMTNNYALSSKKIKDLLNSYTAYGFSLGYGMDSIFSPLELSLNYMNHSSKVRFFVNLGFRF